MNNIYFKCLLIVFFILNATYKAFSIDPPTTLSEQSFFIGATVDDLIATPPSGSTVQWYDVSTGGSPLSGETILTTRNYYAESYDSGVTSTTRTIVAVTILGGESQRNVAYEFVPQVEKTEIMDVISSPVEEVLQSKTYADGFGRPTQKISLEISPGMRDLVQPFDDYDPLGRQAKQYLPFVAPANNGGLFVENAIDPSNWTEHFGTLEDDYAFSETVFEDSPLGRPIEQGGVGSVYQVNADPTADDKTTMIEYGRSYFNEVLRWVVTEEGDLMLSENVYYGAYALTFTIMKDQNWSPSDGEKGTVKTYKDKSGKEILTIAWDDNGERYETYKVYDDYGNLRFIIPPAAIQYITDKGIENISETRIYDADVTLTAPPSNEDYYYMPGVSVTLDPGFTATDGFSISPYPMNAAIIGNLLYVFEYDIRDRLVGQKSPGAGWQYTIYDNHDRVILTQDAVQRKTNEWSFVKYDYLDRPVMAGFYTDNMYTTREAMQDHVNSVFGSTATWHEIRGIAIHGYSNTSFPTAITESSCLTITYYDDYDFMTSWGSDYEYDNTNDIYNGPVMAYLSGVTTGIKTKILGQDTWLKSVTYYEPKDFNGVQTIAEHHMGGIERLYNQFDYSGKILKTRVVHEINSSKSITIDERFEYDHAGRLMKHYHALDQQPEVLLASYTYNELGQMVDQKMHSDDGGATYAQSVDYHHSIQGYLTSINNASRTIGTNNDDADDLFGMELFYDSSPSGLDFEEAFNGNIAGVTWSNSNMGNHQRSYAYSYDKLNRLTASEYKEYDGTSWTDDGHYDVDIEGFDKNGNITGLTRKADNQLIDDLDYQYDENSNQLVAVNDATNNDLGFKDGAESSAEYGYDEAGSLLYDLNKSITNITYNELGLTSTVQFANGNEIRFVYDATGAKLTQKYYKGGILKSYTDFVGGMIFENDSLRIIPSSGGRIVVEHVGADFVYDYQYVISDHLGNSRVLFGPEVRTYLATMEEELETSEEALFNNISSTRSQNYNHTPAGTVDDPNESSMLNATITNVDGTRRMIGPSIGLKVYPGDQVDMEVFALYESTCSASQSSVNSVLFTALMANFGLSGTGETQQIYNAFNNVIGGVTLFDQDQCDVPKAFINYIFFDKNYQNPSFGFRQISESAEGSFEQLTLPFTAAQEGYLYIYVSNESNLNANVYFDDFKVTHTSAATLMQADDFYPFGMSISDLGYKKDGTEPNRFLYQGKEWMDEEDMALAMYDFHARMYDPALGRFLGVDPQGQFASPYLAMGNIPTMGVDPDGEFVFLPILIGAVVGGAFNVATNWNNLDNFWDGVKYFGVGAAGGALGVATGNFAISGAIIGGGNTALQGGSALDIVVNSGIGALAGWAGGTVGGYVSNSLAANGITGGLVGGFLTGASGGATGGLIGGFGTTLYNSKGDFGLAIEAGLKGGFYGGLFGGLAGGTIEVGKSLIGGNNIWNGNKVASGRNIFSLNNKPKPSFVVEEPVMTLNQPKDGWDFSYNKKLYRGTTGSENKGGALFLTDDPGYAAGWVKNGGQLVKVEIPMDEFYRLQNQGLIQSFQGVNHVTGQVGLEFVIYNQELKKSIVNLFQSFN